jgi:hypothetical protein
MKIRLPHLFFRLSRTVKTVRPYDFQKSTRVLFLFFILKENMAIYKVRKRNGSIVTFDQQKITSAIQQAIEAVGLETVHGAATYSEQVVKHLQSVGI